MDVPLVQNRDLKILNVIWIFRRFKDIRTGWAGWASAYPSLVDQENMPTQNWSASYTSTDLLITIVL